MEGAHRRNARSTCASARPSASRCWNSRTRASSWRRSRRIARVGAHLHRSTASCELVAGKLDTETASMAKWWITDMQQKVLDECVQLHGGYGYMNEYLVCRAVRRLPRAAHLRRHQRDHERSHRARVVTMNDLVTPLNADPTAVRTARNRWHQARWFCVRAVPRRPQHPRAAEISVVTARPARTRLRGWPPQALLQSFRVPGHHGGSGYLLRDRHRRALVLGHHAVGWLRSRR